MHLLVIRIRVTFMKIDSVELIRKQLSTRACLCLINNNLIPYNERSANDTVEDIRSMVRAKINAGKLSIKTKNIGQKTYAEILDWCEYQPPGITELNNEELLAYDNKLKELLQRTLAYLPKNCAVKTDIQYQLGMFDKLKEKPSKTVDERTFVPDEMKEMKHNVRYVVSLNNLEYPVRVSERRTNETDSKIGLTPSMTLFLQDIEEHRKIYYLPEEKTWCIYSRGEYHPIQFELKGRLPSRFEFDSNWMNKLRAMKEDIKKKIQRDYEKPVVKENYLNEKRASSIAVTFCFNNEGKDNQEIINGLTKSIEHLESKTTLSSSEDVLFHNYDFGIRNLNILRLYLFTDLTLKDIGSRYGISSGRAKGIVDKLARSMRHHSMRRFYE